MGYDILVYCAKYQQKPNDSYWELLEGKEPRWLGRYNWLGTVLGAEPNGHGRLPENLNWRSTNVGIDYWTVEYQEWGKPSNRLIPEIKILEPKPLLIGLEQRYQRFIGEPNSHRQTDFSQIKQELEELIRVCRFAIEKGYGICILHSV